MNMTEKFKTYIPNLLLVGYKKGTASMIDSEFVKSEFIYYKNYDRFRVFFIVDEHGLACIIESLIINQIVYVADASEVGKINEIISRLLDEIIIVDKQFTETKLDYHEIGDDVVNMLYSLQKN